MNQIAKRLLCILLTLCTLLPLSALLPMPASAAYRYSIVNGHLKVRGTGEAGGVSARADEYPWNGMRDEITEVTVEEGITAVGKDAFSKCPNLKKVTFAKTVSAIGMDAMAYDGQLTEIVFLGRIESIAQGTIYGSGNLKTVVLSPEQTRAEFLQITRRTNYNEGYLSAEYPGKGEDGSLPVLPAFGVIENYEGATYFIAAGVTKAVNDALRSGAYTLQMQVTDENTGKVYTVNPYRFDDKSREIAYDGSFLRLAVCRYGIVPVLGHAYTLALTIYEKGVVRHWGVSDSGAFSSFNDAFRSEGPIVPDPIPYEYDEMPLFTLYDVDLNDAVNEDDISAFLQRLSGAPVPAHGKGVDLDRDGRESIRDLTLYLKILQDGYGTQSDPAGGVSVTGTIYLKKELKLPDTIAGETVASIGPGAFDNCKQLEKITLPASVTWIDPTAFSGCTRLRSIEYPGKAQTFFASGLRLPDGCRAVFSDQSDPMDALDDSSAVAISDLSGYGGTLRIKSTGELLFSPTFSELQAAGEYENYVAYLRFSGDGLQYPSMKLAPQKAKGGWVDFFLQGKDLKGSFCPTAGREYEIELALVRKDDPQRTLYRGLYVVSAPQEYADSPYYDPTPVSLACGKKTSALVYLSGAGGSVSGRTRQYLSSDEGSSAVLAQPEPGYVFALWSDGVRTALRRGDVTASSRTYTALFLPEGDELHVPFVFVSTASGKSIVTKEYEQANIEIRGSEGGKYDVSLPMTVKGRGNSSFSGGAAPDDYNSKNSYSIKLQEKAQLLGLGEGKAKKWVLNAEKFDVSTLRNYLTWDFAKRMGTVGFVPDSAPVQLFVNGEYRGLYTLSEKVTADRHRVPAQEDPTGNSDKSYLIEVDFRGDGERDPYFYVSGYNRNTEFVVKSLVEGQEDLTFLEKYLQRCHNAIMSGTRSAIEKLVDLPSLIDMYILEELAKDVDVGSASFYLYKEAGGKLYFTAPWDFDFGYGTYGPGVSDSGLVSEGEGGCRWFAALIGQKWFARAVCDRMEELRGAFEQTLRAVEREGESRKDDADLNNALWGVYGVHYHGYVSGQVSSERTDYDDQIAFLLSWARSRYEKLSQEMKRRS